MLFKVTHINEAGRCHRARVTALNMKDALDQVDERFGDAVRLSCLRLRPTPVFVVGAVPPSKPSAQRGAACAL
jgi:hypothetical protein